MNSWNPLNWSGPWFLALLTPLMVLSWVAAYLVRRHFSVPAGEPPSDAELEKLHPYEVAYLAEGSAMVFRAALAALVHRGVVRVSAEEHTATIARPVDQHPHAMEEALYRQFRRSDLPAAAEGKLNHELRAWNKSRVADGLRARLDVLGLLVPRDAWRRTRLLPWLIVLVPWLIGMAKLGVALWRGKPFVFLTFLLVAGIVAQIAAGSDTLRSRRGDAALRRLRQLMGPLKSSVAFNTYHCSPADVTLAVGLFGLAVLAGGPLDALQAAMKAPANSSGCGGSCGGGCGGGCGGCGGCGD